MRINQTKTSSGGAAHELTSTRRRMLPGTVIGNQRHPQKCSLVVSGMSMEVPAGSPHLCLLHFFGGTPRQQTCSGVPLRCSDPLEPGPILMACRLCSFSARHYLSGAPGSGQALVGIKDKVTSPGFHDSWGGGKHITPKLWCGTVVATGGQAEKGVIPFGGPQGEMRRDFLEEALMFEPDPKRWRKRVVGGNHSRMLRIALGFCKETKGNNNHIF